MLFRRPFLEGIRRGDVTLAFRRWVRPTVRSGGSLLTALGQLEIRSVTPIEADAITDGDARRAGHPSREALLAELDRRDHGRIFRIELGALRPDPRVALREAPPGDAEREALLARLRRLDDRAAGGPWTARTLALIGAHPGRRAADLCRLAGMEKDAFKVNVRKLKNLGLTESLETGYRLSPRGAALLER